MAKIVYIEDIVKEMSEEFGMSEVEIREICDNSIHYLNLQLAEPEIISVRLPFLGLLYFNHKRAKFTFNISNAYRKHKDKVAKQIELIEKLRREHFNLIHTTYSYYTQIRSLFFKKSKDRLRSKKADVYEKLEKKQNNLF